MEKKKEIPSKILRLAKEFSQYDGYVIFIGTYNGKEIYTYHFNEIVTTGMPVFYVWDGVKAKKEIGENLPYFNLLKK